MKRTGLILIAVFAMVMIPAAFGQGTAAQSQSPNPQTPSTPPPSQSPSTDNPSSASAASDAQHRFVGSIVKNGDRFMLHTSGADYQLDEQNQASKFEGKDVQVTGEVDQLTNTIRVQSIVPRSK